jgi:hypothetical protein
VLMKCVSFSDGSGISCYTSLLSNVGMTVNEELGKIRKEAVAVKFNNILYWQALRKITIHLSKDSQYLSRDSNRAPLEYKSEALPLEPGYCKQDRDSRHVSIYRYS